LYTFFKSEQNAAAGEHRRSGSGVATSHTPPPKNSKITTGKEIIKAPFSHNVYKTAVKQKTFGVLLFYCFVISRENGDFLCAAGFILQFCHSPV